MEMRKFYDIQFSGFIPQVEADSPEHAVKLVREYLHNYAWFSTKLEHEEEIKSAQ